MTHPDHNLAPHIFCQLIPGRPLPGASRAPGIAGQNGVSVGEEQAEAGRRAYAAENKIIFCTIIYLFKLDFTGVLTAQFF